MNARARAVLPRLYAPERPTVFRYWAPALLALCLVSWLAAIGAGRLIVQHI